MLPGFYAVLILHGVASVIYVAIYTGALALHSGVNTFIKAFVYDLQALFDQMDVENAKNYPHLKIYQIEAIQFHNHITRQIFCNFYSSSV